MSILNRLYVPLTLLSLCACSSTTPSVKLQTTVTAAQLYNDLGGDPFQYTIGLSVEGSESYPEDLLGFVRERDGICRDNPVDNTCVWIPAYGHFFKDNITIKTLDDSEYDEVADTTVTVSSAAAAGLLSFLEIEMGEDSVINVIKTQTYGGAIENDTLREEEIDRYMLEYGNAEKEQAFTDSVSFYTIQMIEYYFVSEELPSDYKDNNDKYVEFSDGWYKDSERFINREIALSRLQPMSPVE